MHVVLGLSTFVMKVKTSHEITIVNIEIENMNGIFSLKNTATFCTIGM